MSAGVIHGPGPLQALDDALNPVLVKEMRQALRGRFFGVIFSVMILLVALVAAGHLLFHGGVSETGRSYFRTLFLCYSVLALCIVPFAAFHGMASERDGNTFELLILTDLRPGRIVLGKMLSALAQSLLYLSALVPLLTVSFLIGGVDPLASLVLVGSASFMSPFLCLLAIALATLSRREGGRAVLMATLGAITMLSVLLLAGFASLLLSQPEAIFSPPWLALGLVVVVGGTLAAAAWDLACTRIGHRADYRPIGAGPTTPLAARAQPRGTEA